ncbi:hypothetical protein [Effusibacillus dendaii]|uniref:AP2 domain-containing protein n=1 Tax=Effusibacillus dendaii TaxID=2743772 RepID=A0A7I8D8W2_9BACL|nr:hypothetical protein [Effusibacillus dendaii]BCJ86437.1 hypothetical protein skT53_14220 [Effusibacillus dendaii]
MGKPRMDLTGQHYGRLTVVKEVEPNGYTRRWLCQCDCGNEKIVTMYNLRTGHTVSCGCVQKERASQKNTDDLTGSVFGRLKVLRRSDTKPYKSRHVFWECMCDCGNTTIVDGVHLKDGTTQSCGCLRSDKGVELQEYNNANLYSDGVFTPVLKSKLRTDNSTGVKGVSRKRKKDGTIVYRANIRVKSKSYYLGEYATVEEATAARKRGEEEYHKPYLEGEHDE